MLDGGTKGLPAGSRLEIADIEGQGWNVLAGDTGTPIAVLRDAAVNNNIDVMRHYCAAAGVSIAPHGKTTMAPSLISRQLAAGARGITAASVQQAILLVRTGVRRVLVANEVTDPKALSQIGAMLAAVPDLEIIWYVDSSAGLSLAAAASRGWPRPAELLVEIGYPGGRTGLRDDQSALQLARAVASTDGVRLAGIAGYEGTIGVTREPLVLARVTQFVERIRDLHAQCVDEGLFGSSGSIMTAGGSLYFDIVAQTLKPAAGDDVTVVLRSGCYVTHDHGLYGDGSPANGTKWTFGRFEPALEVWARVLSRPEPGLALLDAGRRDLSHDAGLPVPLAWSHPSEPARRPLEGARVSALSDQHTFVTVPEGHELAVGDLVGLGISHPCTTFDRWPLMLLVDDDGLVTGAVETML